MASAGRVRSHATTQKLQSRKGKGSGWQRAHPLPRHIDGSDAPRRAEKGTRLAGGFSVPPPDSLDVHPVPTGTGTAVFIRSDRRRIPSVERLIPQADMQYKVLSITSAEIVIESKSGAKHIIEYGKGARPHIDLRKVRGEHQLHIAHAFVVAEFESRETNAVVHFGFRHMSYIACHCIVSQIVPIFCENDIVDVEDFEAIDTARANLSRRLMIALRAEKYVVR